jgi:hypothetical protein
VARQSHAKNTFENSVACFVLVLVLVLVLVFSKYSEDEDEDEDEDDWRIWRFKTVLSTFGFNG